jgi:hypothetical protein
MENENNVESRSNYQKEYREKKGMKQFNTTIPAELFDKLSRKLDRQFKSKKEWLCEKIIEELEGGA